MTRCRPVAAAEASGAVAAVAAATVGVAGAEAEEEAAEVAASTTSGLREENLRAGDVSPALSGVSGGGSPAHSDCQRRRH